MDLPAAVHEGGTMQADASEAEPDVPLDTAPEGETDESTDTETGSGAASGNEDLHDATPSGLAMIRPPFPRVRTTKLPTA